jgi:hypothetical protein
LAGILNCSQSSIIKYNYKSIDGVVLVLRYSVYLEDIGMIENSIKGLKVLQEEDEICLTGGAARAYGFADARGLDPKDADARTSVIVEAIDDGVFRYARSTSIASIVLQ